MLSLANRTLKHLSEPAAAPICIGVGLTMLFVFDRWPLPVLTATAFIILGATLATIDRFSNSPALPFVLVLHSLTYACLLAVFVGTLLHTADSFTLFHALDITATTVLVAISAERVLIGLRTHYGLPR